MKASSKPTPEGVFFNADKVYRALVEWKYDSPPYAEPGGTIYRPDTSDFYFPQGNSWGPYRFHCHGALGAVMHAYALDSDLSHDGAYWEKLYSGRAKELQDRFDNGRMYTNRQENSFMLNEEQTTHENSLAVWAKWTVLQRDFKISKEAP